MKLEAEHFIDCIKNEQPLINDGISGLRVVKLLEAANTSIEKRGHIVYI